MLQAGIQRAHSLDNPQAGAYSPLRIVLVRLRIAKVHQKAVTKVLRDVAVKALDHVGAGGLIGAHDLTVVFRIELSGQEGRVYQITKQHRELPTFRLCGAA